MHYRVFRNSFDLFCKLNKLIWLLSFIFPLLSTTQIPISRDNPNKLKDILKSQVGLNYTSHSKYPQNTNNQNLLRRFNDLNIDVSHVNIERYYEKYLCEIKKDVDPHLQGVFIHLLRNRVDEEDNKEHFTCQKDTQHDIIREYS